MTLSHSARWCSVPLDEAEQSIDGPRPCAPVCVCAPTPQGAAAALLASPDPRDPMWASGPVRTSREGRRASRRRDVEQPQAIAACPPAGGAPARVSPSTRSTKTPRGRRLTGRGRRRSPEPGESTLKSADSISRQFRATRPQHSILNSAAALQKPETCPKNTFSGLKLDHKIAQSAFSTVSADAPDAPIRLDRKILQQPSSGVAAPARNAPAATRRESGRNHFRVDSRPPSSRSPSGSRPAGRHTRLAGLLVRLRGRWRSERRHPASARRDPPRHHRPRSTKLTTRNPRHTSRETR